MTTFTIQQYVNHANQFEAMPEGDFNSQESAVAAMKDLVSDCGYSNMRVVDAAGQVVAKSE